MKEIQDQEELIKRIEKRIKRIDQKILRIKKKSFGLEKENMDCYQKLGDLKELEKESELLSLVFAIFLSIFIFSLCISPILINYFLFFYLKLLFVVNLIGGIVEVSVSKIIQFVYHTKRKRKQEEIDLLLNTIRSLDEKRREVSFYYSYLYQYREQLFGLLQREKRRLKDMLYLELDQILQERIILEENREIDYSYQRIRNH